MLVGQGDPTIIMVHSDKAVEAIKKFSSDMLNVECGTP
jgi:hypothetical protein